MTPPPIAESICLARYDLLCRALQASPSAADPQRALEEIASLEALIHTRLLALARAASPDDFADIFLGFTRELMRFREFCAEPRLAHKRVVAFGGPFSAGKSSLINALLGQKLLVVEVDPTTALPAYLFQGDEDAIHALNLHGRRITLSEEEFATLTHDEPHRYGSQVARALTAAFITRRAFPWQNLAFIDTPGYTGGAAAGDRTDANLALAQLNSAHAIVWVVSIKQGDLSESDLDFLARLDPELPRIVVASHADQMTERDRAAIVARMAYTLTTHNLPTLGVYPVSTRKSLAALLAPVRQQLDRWNETPRAHRFAHRFKELFVRYQRGLEREAARARWQLHRIHRLAMLTDGELARDADELKQAVSTRLKELETVAATLDELRQRFFRALKQAGDAVGIPLPEPHEVDLLAPGRSNLREQLKALRGRAEETAPDVGLSLAPLTAPATVRRHAYLLRHHWTNELRRRAQERLAPLCLPRTAVRRMSLCRLPDRTALQNALATLRLNLESPDETIRNAQKSRR